MGRLSIGGTLQGDFACTAAVLSGPLHCAADGEAQQQGHPEVGTDYLITKVQAPGVAESIAERKALQVPLRLCTSGSSS